MVAACTTNSHLHVFSQRRHGRLPDQRHQFRACTYSPCCTPPRNGAHLPVMCSVRTARLSKSTSLASGTERHATRRMSTRPARSGGGTYTCTSNLPGRSSAVSRAPVVRLMVTIVHCSVVHGRLVAASTTTPCEASSPSISTSSAVSSRTAALVPPVPLPRVPGRHDRSQESTPTSHTGQGIDLVQKDNGGRSAPRLLESLPEEGLPLPNVHGIQAGGRQRHHGAPSGCCNGPCQGRFAAPGWPVQQDPSWGPYAQAGKGIWVLQWPFNCLLKGAADSVHAPDVVPCHCWTAVQCHKRAHTHQG